MQSISIQGARTHNLKNIDVSLPRDKLIVITGLSGSGKSSLAFDTLYAEGQRRYVESLSAYARQFLSMMEKPDVDHIEGLSPAISIEQKSTSHNPRSTVGTITEIYDYLRLLYARTGQPRCPIHDTVLEAQTISQMVDQIMSYPEDTKVMILAPLVQNRKGEHSQLFESLRTQGYVRVRIDGELYELSDLPNLDARRKHDIEVVVDRIKVRQDIKSRLADSLETTINLSEGTAIVAVLDKDKAQDSLLSAKFSCYQCGYSLAELEPRLFSFNNPKGACPECDGIGHKQFIDPNKVVYDKGLSLASGAIRQWDKHSFYYYNMLKSLAKHYKFSLETPYNKLPKKITHCLLYGSGEDVITFTYPNENGRSATRKHSFEGIIPNMERRYHSTESQYVRDELSRYFTQRTCPACDGTRLNEGARHVFIQDKRIPDITSLSIADASTFFKQLSLPGWRGKVADKILKEIISRLEFLVNVGLDYLSLSRNADTLSGGEAQRIRLASQIGAGLVGVMYVLDEPSIGLHQRDNERLLKTLIHLRDIGNTVIVVEHDEDAILSADHVIDMGPGAGMHGGTVVAEGTPAQIKKCSRSLTGQYLSGKKCIPVPEQRLPFQKERCLTLSGATGHNLDNLTIEIPLGVLTCVTGVSGSGKSTLINDTLYPITAQCLNGAKQVEPLDYQEISGLEHLDKVVDIDQSPIGRTPRSNAATYTGIFGDIRDLFSNTPESRTRGYKPGRFSFNVKGGRCEACQGDGLIKVEMHFLADIYVPCDICQGKRYNRETLEIQYKGKNIHQVLEMTVVEALDFFQAIPPIARKLQTLIDVGLTYISLGQRATTLSGGEAQRVKLAKELSRRDTGRTLYILDEPTTGLHFEDVAHLLSVLLHLRDRGNTIVVIEHNLDVIKSADWLIDLGPEGGDKGGKLLAVGTPETVAKHKKSHTGRFLKAML